MITKYSWVLALFLSICLIFLIISLSDKMKKYNQDKYLKEKSIQDSLDSYIWIVDTIIKGDTCYYVHTHNKSNIDIEWVMIFKEKPTFSIKDTIKNTLN